MAKSNYYAMIMAGGRGTRFWPRSRRRCAKQVLNVVGERTLIQQTFDRLRPFLPPERMWIITNEYLRGEIGRQLPEVPRRQIIAEPAQRNTAPCNGLAAHILCSLDPKAVVGVFPADHVMLRPARFRRLLGIGYRAAERGGGLLTLGIAPRWPETGYGYLEFPPGTKAGAPEPLPVLHFHEKPDEATAKCYVEAGNFYWNAGVFFWRADAFLNALRKHLPKTATLLAALPPFGSRRFSAQLGEVYPRCENISVDYAVMEKAENVAGLAADDIGWNDVGSWNAVYELVPHDKDGNAARAAELLSQGSARNYVDADGKLVALLGVEDLIVVDTKDALLVAARSKAQKVSDLVKALEAKKREDLL